MHVGFFSFPRLVHGGGFEKYLIELANDLSARDHRASIVTASPRQYDVLQRTLNLYYGNPLGYDNSRVSDSELRGRLAGPELHEVPVTRMAALLRRCDVVYAKNEILDLSVLRLLGLGRLPPIVVGVHTPMWYPRAPSSRARLHNRLYLGRVYRTLLAGAAAVHCSNGHDTELFPRVHGWPSDRVYHVPYPYDAHVVNAVQRPGNGPLPILFAGRLTEQKGVDVLLQLIERLNARADGFSMTVAGSGEPRWEEQLRAAAERHANVYYLGHVPHEQMPRLYGEAAVAIVPSNWETFPYACLEPQSQGVPVLASDIPGCQDIVADGRTGFLFPVGDVDAAERVLLRVRKLQLEAPGELVELGRRAVERVRRHSNRAEVVDAVEGMLLEVAEARARRRPGPEREGVLLSRLRERGLAGTAGFAVRLAGVAVRSPRDALDHISTQLALGRAAPPLAEAPADASWRRTLHETLGEPWPCAEHDEFHALWGELMEELSVRAPVGTGHDADPTLSEAAWCVVRHERPEVVVETGVSRGITARVILEALTKNDSGRLWSVDLPPLEEPWRRLAGSAVPARLRGSWTYVRGSSRRRLPPLVRELGRIDLFLHDSLHVEANLRFELEQVWPVLRPGGLALIDDAQACRAFDGIVSELDPAAAFAAPHCAKGDVVGIVRKAAAGAAR